MNPELKTKLCILLFAPIWLLLYTILHEGGHALVILAYGGTIDRFWVLGLNAHVSAHGAVYSTFGEALMNAAGMLLPAVISIISLFIYQPKVKFAGYHLCYFMILVSYIGSMLVWIIFPIVSLFTSPPQGEDVTKFLNVTKFHPILVSLGAFLLVGVFVFFMCRKGIFGKVFRKVKE